MVRLARPHEINEIIQLTQACARHMIQQGIYQWNEHYPAINILENDIERGELFVFEKNTSIIGIIVVSSHKDAEYDEITWITPQKAKAIYIHRLAVHPLFQGKGYAQKLMDFAETKAKEEGYDSVRLDTFSQNKRNQRFYEQRGYKRLGDIYFPKQSTHPFHCYELVI